jgi:hypothetical protein
MREHVFRITLLGLASWAIPFATSFLFIGPGGLMWAPEPLFKSIMVVVSGGAGAFLLLAAFRHLGSTPANAFLVGAYWLVINVVLDLLILLPMAGMSVPDYVMAIAVRYLLIPILAVCIALAGRSHA